MFGIGGPELIVILVIALLFVGPDKLPQVAKTVGTGIRDLRRMANLTQSELRSAMDDLTKEVEHLADSPTETKPLPTAPLVAKAGDPDLDKPAPPATAKLPPVEGETLMVVSRREPGPPAPGFVLTPASGSRERAGEWTREPVVAAGEAAGAADGPAPTDEPAPPDASADKAPGA